MIVLDTDVVSEAKRGRLGRALDRLLAVFSGRVDTGVTLIDPWHAR